MPVIKYIFLGIIQGLTEFLPVSSSAHLVIFQDLFQIQENQLLLDIVLHLGTLLALVVFLFKDIRRLLWYTKADSIYHLNKRILLFLILATGLTAVIAILGEGLFASMFSSGKRLFLPLLMTGLILLCTKKFTRGVRNFANLKIADGLWLGIVQGISVIPGLSRSGLTISTLLFRNVEKETAFKFSFLASILAILGALFFKAGEFSQLALFEFKYMAFGFFASLLSGLLSLKILLIAIRRARLHLFGYYCLVLAAVVGIGSI